MCNAQKCWDCNLVGTRTRRVVPVHAMKIYRRSRGIAPGILNLASKWRWVVKFTTWTLGKNRDIH
jgi:hypothetical protein